MRPSVTCQFLICPPEVAFDRDQNLTLKIHFWATCCVGSMTVLIYRKSLIYLANKKGHFGAPLIQTLIKTQYGTMTMQKLIENVLVPRDETKQNLSNWFYGILD